MHCPDDLLEERLGRLLMDHRFDMFFVDGFDRPLILRMLRQHLSKHPGFVVIHDYARETYSEEIQRFTNRQPITKAGTNHQGLMLLEQKTL